jgi:hypothetical protein
VATYESVKGGSDGSTATVVADGRLSRCDESGLCRAKEGVTGAAAVSTEARLRVVTVSSKSSWTLPVGDGRLAVSEEAGRAEDACSEESAEAKIEDR